jgi:6-pyruvoyltetrahydropterin/6-carboxytetrahydropterin synthase
MLSKHPERCRFPHGHSRRVEVVVSSESLDARDMVVDFKALKLAVRDLIEKFDHAMAINSADPLLPAIRQTHPDSIIEFEVDPTTEVLAKHLFDEISRVLAGGFENANYVIVPGQVTLERVRVGETADSWAEYGI